MRRQARAKESSCASITIVPPDPLVAPESGTAEPSETAVATVPVASPATLPPSGPWRSDVAAPLHDLDRKAVLPTAFARRRSGGLPMTPPELRAAMKAKATAAANVADAAVTSTDAPKGAGCTEPRTPE